MSAFTENIENQRGGEFRVTPFPRFDVPVQTAYVDKSTSPMMTSSLSSLQSRKSPNSGDGVLLEEILLSNGRLPHYIAMLFGMHFVRPEASTFTPWNVPTLCGLVRVPYLIFMLWYFLAHRVLFDKLFGDWGSTEEFSHGMSVFFVILCDFLCAILSFNHGKEMTALFEHLKAFILDITEKAQMPLGYYPQKLIAEMAYLKWMVRAILVLFCVGSLSAMVHSIMKAIYMESVNSTLPPELHVDNCIIASIPFFVITFVGMLTLRQVAYYGPIFLLSHMAFGISSLKDFIRKEVDNLQRSKVTESELEKRVDVMLNYFQNVYDLVDEINLRFQWVFLTAVISLWVVVICGWFEICIWALDEAPMTTAIATAVSVSTNSITFYLLCAKASKITAEVRGCMVLLRDLQTILEETGNEDEEKSEEMEQLHNVIRMWHLEGTMQPPVISPGNFFILRKRLIPSVLAMMVTYLLVLVQFRLKDDKDMKSGVGNSSNTSVAASTFVDVSNHREHDHYEI